MRRLALLAPLVVGACSVAHGGPITGAAGFDVTVSIPGHGAVGPTTPTLPVDLYASTETFEIDVRALGATGELDPTFEGFVRVSIHPGAVVSVAGEGATGRNVFVKAGVATSQVVTVTGSHGPTRIWVEDLGYTPAAASKPPACSNGRDDDGDGLVDFPGDPGCAFANDDSETGGTYATGLSTPIPFAAPTLADAQGRGASSPYVEEQVDLAAAAPANLVVTRITPDGFYVSDTNEQAGYGHLFAFSFSTPPGLRVCDRLESLSGTLSEFHGFTELGSPGFVAHPWDFRAPADGGDGPCQVPEPTVLDHVVLGVWQCSQQTGKFSSVADDAALERLESGLVRVTGLRLPKFFGPGHPASANGFEPDATHTNCDLNDDGKLDFTTAGSVEAACVARCDCVSECTEWTNYVANGAFRVLLTDGAEVQVNTSTIPSFDPPSHRGELVSSLTGTLRDFSGGSYNWTIEARCDDDLVLPCAAGDAACLESPPGPQSSQIACVDPRTQEDNAGN